MIQLAIGFGYLGVTHLDQAKNLIRDGGSSPWSPCSSWC